MIDTPSTLGLCGAVHLAEYRKPLPRLTFWQRRTPRGTERRQLRGNERPQKRVLLTAREKLLAVSLALVALAAAIGWLA